MSSFENDTVRKNIYLQLLITNIEQLKLICKKKSMGKQWYFSFNV